MRFQITVHSRQGAPDDAIPRLAELLGARRGDASFSIRRGRLQAIWGEESPSALARDEREEEGRLALLEIIARACEQDPELQLAWYAVSAARE